MKYIPKEFPADFENVNTNKIESYNRILFCFQPLCRFLMCHLSRVQILKASLT